MPLEERPALRNGVYHHTTFRKSRHRIQAMDVGGMLFGGLLMAIGIALSLCVLFGVAWVAFWLGEAVLRWFK